MSLPNNSTPEDPLVADESQSEVDFEKAPSLMEMQPSCNVFIPSYCPVSDCETCASMIKLWQQLQELATQNSTLGAAYSLARQELDLQVQHTNTKDRQLVIERNARIVADNQCNILNERLSSVEAKRDRDGARYSDTISKLIDILHAWKEGYPACDEALTEGSSTKRKRRYT